MQVISTLDFAKKAFVYKTLVLRILSLIKTTILDRALASKRTFSYVQSPLGNLVASEFKFNRYTTYSKLQEYYNLKRL